MTVVEISLWIILTATVLGYLKYYYFSHESVVTMFGLLKESMAKMEEPTKVILFGDSVLNNSRYVPLGKSVGAFCRDIYGRELRIYAQDGASINNVYNQIEQCASNSDASGKMHLIISAGGNNLLNAMNVHALNDQTVDKYASQYERLVKQVMSTFPEARVYLLNVYHPTEKRYQNISKYIDRWNETVVTLIESGKLEDRVAMIDIDSLLTEEEDFVDDIEPSSKGGKKITRAIVDNINEFL